MCYHCIITEADLDQWIERLRKAPVFAFDTKTTSLEYIWKQNWSAFHLLLRRVKHYGYLGAPEQLPLMQMLDRLKPLLEDDRISKIGQNLKCDASVLANYDV